MKKFYDKYSWLIIILLVGLVVFTCSKNSEPKPITPIDLKPEIKAQDSFRTIIKYIEKERIKEVVKWQKTKEKYQSDSVPCYTEVRYVIAQADTVMKVDSLLISALKNQHNNDTVIQVKQADIIRQKTDSIATLSKKLKWQKLKTKGVWLAWGIREAVGVGSKIKN